MAIITAVNAAKLMLYGSTAKVDTFNKYVSYQALREDELFSVLLPFQQFGSGIADIQFVIDAGYVVNKDSENRVWIVTIPDKTDPVPEPQKIVLDMNIPSAAIAVKLFPSFEDRKHALFKSYVDQELNKMDLFPFRVYLSFSMWGSAQEDVQFVTDAGYVVVRDEDNECWNISLPGDDS